MKPLGRKYLAVDSWIQLNWKAIFWVVFLFFMLFGWLVFPDKPGQDSHPGDTYNYCQKSCD